MTERDEDNKVAAIRLIPVGTDDMDYELVNAKGRRVEVGPIFGKGSNESANNQSADVENISEGVKWFRENGGV